MTSTITQFIFWVYEYMSGMNTCFFDKYLVLTRKHVYNGVCCQISVLHIVFMRLSCVCTQMFLSGRFRRTSMSADTRELQR